MLEYLKELLKYQLELLETYHKLFLLSEDKELKQYLKMNYKELVLVNAELMKLYKHMVDIDDDSDSDEEDDVKDNIDD